MIINIHGKNLEVTEIMISAINRSLSRLERFNKFIKPETRAKVEVRSYPDRTYKITVNISLPFNKHLQCHVQDHDLYAAIKQVVNPLTQQLNHLKTEIENKYHAAAGAGEVIIENEQDESSAYEIEELENTEQLDGSYNDYDQKN